MKLLYVLVLIPFAAMANPLETDYEKIFADNADSVTERDGGKSVTLPGNVIVSQNAEGRTIALDGSPHEAVGCVLQVTLQSAAVGRLCPDSLTADQTATLDANIADIAKFYSENNIPQSPLDQVQKAMDDSVSALSKRLENIQCDTGDVDRFKEFVASLTGEKAQQKLSASLLDPRLPTVNPCL